MKLVENAKLWWKMWSVRFWLLIALVPEVLAQLSDDVKDALPGYMRATLSVFALISIGLRLTKQKSIPKNDDPSSSH